MKIPKSGLACVKGFSRALSTRPPDPSRVVSVVTASSNTGRACIGALTNDSSLHIRAVFRSDEKARASGLETKEVPGDGATLEIVTGIDAYDVHSLNSAFAGSDVAVVVAPHDPTRGFRDDAMLTVNMIDAAAAQGVQHIVYIGSWTVHEPKSVSALSARFIPAEIRLRELTAVHEDAMVGKGHSLTWSSLRSGFFNSNLAVMFSSLQSSDVLRFPAECVFAPVDPRDVGKAAAALSRSRTPFVTGTYEISGPEMLSMEKMAAIFAHALDRPIHFGAVDVGHYAATLPPPLAELMRFMAAKGESAIPCSDDVFLLTGVPAIGLFEWVKEHAHLFPRD